jgi:hypothetical protein
MMELLEARTQELNKRVMDAEEQINRMMAVMAESPEGSGSGRKRKYSGSKDVGDSCKVGRTMLIFCIPGLAVASQPTAMALTGDQWRTSKKTPMVMNETISMNPGVFSRSGEILWGYSRPVRQEAL